MFRARKAPQLALTAGVLLLVGGSPREPAPKSAAALQDRVELREISVEEHDGWWYFKAIVAWPAETLEHRTYAEYRPGGLFGERYGWPADSVALIPQDSTTELVHGLAVPLDVAGEHDLILLRNTQVIELPGEFAFFGRMRRPGRARFLLRYPGPDFGWQYHPMEIDFSAAPEREGIHADWAYAYAIRFHNLSAELPGVSFFAYAAEGVMDRAGLVLDERPIEFRWELREQVGEAYELFSGALAMQESLQIDRMREPARQLGERTIPVDEIAGIETPSHPWEEMLAGRQPTVEAVAALVPRDQYYARFRALGDLVDALDFTLRWGGIGLSLMESSGQDYGTYARLEEQLGLQAAALVRALGGDAVECVVLTGYDPYFREGTDLTVIFEARRPAVVAGALDAQLHAAGREHADAELGRYEVSGVEVRYAVSPDRALRAYRCTLGERYFVCSNSPAAIERVIATHADSKRSLARSLDFVYMRSVYPLGDAAEDGFVFLSDAFIRNLTGPALRIAERRRIEAFATLETIKNAALWHRWENPNEPVLALDQLLARGYLPENLLVVEPGDNVHWHPETFTAWSERYGRFGYLTPSVELAVTHVSEAERAAYEEFREQYRQRWRRFFDPIGIRITMGSRIELAVTVLPLVQDSIYDELLDLTGGETIALESLPPGPETLLHLGLHLSASSENLGSIRDWLVETGEMDRDRVGDRIEFWLEDSDVYLRMLENPAAGDALLFEVPAVLAVELEEPVGTPEFHAAFFETLLAEALGGGRVAPEEPYRDYSIIGIDVGGLLGGPADRPTLHFTIAGDTLYLAMRRESLERIIDRRLAGQAELERAAAAEPPNSARDDRPAPHGNAALRLYLGAFREARPFLERMLVGYAYEQQRLNLRRAWLLGRTVGWGPGALAEPRHVLGYDLADLFGGEIRYDSGRDCAVHSLVGSLWEPLVPEELPAEAPGAVLLNEIESLGAAVTIDGDGLHAEVSIERARRRP